MSSSKHQGGGSLKRRNGCASVLALAYLTFPLASFPASAQGTDRETVLHSFGGAGDGSDPFGAVLIRDAAGNL
jgi:hypothetical protein